MSKERSKDEIPLAWKVILVVLLAVGVFVGVFWGIMAG